MRARQTDVWLTGSSLLCHFDGAHWACRDLPGQSLTLALTASHAWLSHATGAGAETELVVVDTTSMTGAITSVGVGPLVAIGDITPVPGAEQVYLTHDPAAFMNGDESARLFSTTGLVRTEAGQAAIPVGADDAYVLAFLSDETRNCAGGIGGSCTVTTNWSQLVVFHVVSGTPTEVAHYTDPSGANVPREALLVDGHLVFPGMPTYQLP